MNNIFILTVPAAAAAVFNDSMNNSDVNVSSSANPCALTIIQKWSIAGVPLLLATSGCLAQLFLIVIFTCWHRAEPFLLLHLNLAVAASLYCASMVVYAVPRTFGVPWSPGITLLVKIAAGAFYILNRLCQVCIIL